MSTTAVGQGGTGLAALMELERLGPDRFRSGAVVHPARPNRPLRVFGGQVAGQALVAAGRTVPGDRAVHSLHAHFLRSGEQAEPIEYAVEALRDGGSCSTRRVVAEQRGVAIFALTASFARAEEGVRHQVPRSAAAGPEDLPPAAEVVAAAGEPNVSNGRALCRGLVFDRAGELVASVMLEAQIRRTGHG